MKQSDKDRIFIIYSWDNNEVIIKTYTVKNALAKVGEDALLGNDVSNYQLIEIDLTEIEE